MKAAVSSKIDDFFKETKEFDFLAEFLNETIKLFFLADTIFFSCSKSLYSYKSDIFVVFQISFSAFDFLSFSRIVLCSIFTEVASIGGFP